MIVPPADINPAVNKLPPATLATEVMLPVAVIKPAVVKLPPATLAVTARLPSVPTLVMLVWLAVVSVPAMFVTLKLPPVMLPEADT